MYGKLTKFIHRVLRYKMQQTAISDNYLSWENQAVLNTYEALYQFERACILQRPRTEVVCPTELVPYLIGPSGSNLFFDFYELALISTRIELHLFLRGQTIHFELNFFGVQNAPLGDWLMTFPKENLGQASLVRLRIHSKSIVSQKILPIP